MTNEEIALQIALKLFDKYTISVDPIVSAKSLYELYLNTLELINEHPHKTSIIETRIKEIEALL